MATTPEQKYVKDYIKRMIALNKAIEGQASSTRSGFVKMHKEVIEQIKNKYGQMNSIALRSMNNELASVMQSYFYSTFIPSVQTIYKDIITKEAAWIAKNITIYSGTKANTVNSSKIAETAIKKTYQGHTFNFWFKSLETKNTKSVLDTLKIGYINGVPTPEVTQQVEKILGKQSRDAETLTRSYMQHASVEARQETYDANEDLIEAYIWLATLDGRTTFEICGVRDGKKYDKNFTPIGHDIPWGAGPGRIHFNCRSSYIVQLVGMSDPRDTLNRAAINAGPEYEKGDMWTKNGKVRKPTKANREKGFFKISQVSAQTDYESFLRRQKKSFINDVLKDKELTDRFKSGEISLLDIVKSGTVKDVNKL